ncbi:MAG TPA: hypothetical protein VHT30_02550 [Acidimicrobiales bacterium]|jgi:hypothetical protein|nr:hypothetical protein [Acidimicrobiales bacterium]
MSTLVSPDPVGQFLEAIEGATIGTCDIFDPDVTMDATVPHWRFSKRGDAAVRSELAGWYPEPGRFEELERTAVPGGEMVRFTLRWEEAGVPFAVHQAHVVEVTGGRVSRDQIWCGGRWSAELLAEMAEASDVQE